VCVCVCVCVGGFLQETSMAYKISFLIFQGHM
jgi:hypothetical protein